MLSLYLLQLGVKLRGQICEMNRMRLLCRLVVDGTFLRVLVREGANRLQQTEPRVTRGSGGLSDETFVDQ